MEQRNPVPLVNIKIGGTWVFRPKMEAAVMTHGHVSFSQTIHFPLIGGSEPCGLVVKEKSLICKNLGQFGVPEKQAIPQNVLRFPFGFLEKPSKKGKQRHETHVFK